MTNREKFCKTFDIFATELWSSSEEQFIKWCNDTYHTDSNVEEVIRCENCSHSRRSYDVSGEGSHKFYCNLHLEWKWDTDFCSSAIARENMENGAVS